jgi:hypothetical protein
MNPRSTQRTPARPIEVGSAFAFGCVALAAVIWLAFRAETLSEQQFEVLRIVLALAGGGIGAVLPGFLDINIKPEANLALRAGGALAIFVVLYFWSPARWQPSDQAAAIQRTQGACSPIQSGNGNSATCTNGSAK